MTPLAKRLTLALALSIGANLLLAGYALGYGWRRALPAASGLTAAGQPVGWAGRGMGRGRGMGMGRGQGLGLGPGGPALRAAVQLRSGELGTCRQDIQKARSAVQDALRREPLDRKVLEQALANLRAQSARAQEVAHQAVLQAAIGETPEQRSELADDFGRGPQGM
jgi:hypothetical protein